MLYGSSVKPALGLAGAGLAGAGLAGPGLARAGLAGPGLAGAAAGMGFKILPIAIGLVAGIGFAVTGFADDSPLDFFHRFSSSSINSVSFFLAANFSLATANFSL